MLERFRGSAGRRRLEEALAAQKLFLGDVDLVNSLYDSIQLEEVEGGAVVISQGDPDNDLVLILSGRLSVQVNSREVAVRSVGEYVGEMALLDPGKPRSATVRALEDSVIGRVPEAALSSAAETKPDLWKRLAVELSSRIREYNALFHPPNPQPVVFIGSSAESLDVARAVEDEFQHETLITQLWTGGVFSPSSSSLSSLLDEVKKADLCVLVLGPSDEVRSRGETSDAPRDNVIFELGLFLGGLGPRRTLFMVPLDKDIKIPTDLLGITPLKYRTEPFSEIANFVRPACNEIRKRVRQLGPK